MADVRRPRDVGVIDEAHLLGDPNRGYAFTRAIMGLPVRELHLCGDPAMVPLVETVAAELGDELVVNRYERLQKLAVLNKPLRRVKDVASGDCHVAFSRRAVHQLKKDVELMAGKRACVIYGSLPPEARARQAELFNDREPAGTTCSSPATPSAWDSTSASEGSSSPPCASSTARTCASWNPPR